MPQHRWQKGESGNPTGRPKRKPITDAILQELARVAKDGGTRAEAAARKLVGLMFSRDAKVALEASKLILAYVEGLPTQPIELEVRRAVADMAARTGADPDWLVKRAAEIASRASAEVDA